MYDGMYYMYILYLNPEQKNSPSKHTFFCMYFYATSLCITCCCSLYMLYTSVAYQNQC